MLMPFSGNPSVADLEGMTEFSAVQMARLEERVRTIITQLELDREDRKSHERKAEEYNRLLVTINSRVEKLEAGISSVAPTIQEFIEFKQKLLGAGFLGKWLWVGVGVLVGFIFSMKTEIATWLTRH
jgi:hypothetical protein